MVSASVLCALFASLVTPGLGAVHEKLASLPQGWSKVKDAADNTQLSLSVALTRENMDQLENKLMDLATPGNAKYSQWMDLDQIDKEFPTADDSGVVNWLHDHGIHKVHRDGSLVHFHTDVGKANKLLDTTFAWYQHGSTQKLRTTQYSLPNNLQHVIDLISGTTFFGEPKPSPGTPPHAHPHPHPPPPPSPPKPFNPFGGSDKPVQVDDSCYKVITPKCIRQLYQVGDYTPSPDSKSRIGYGNFLNETSSYSDLALFEQYFDLPPENFSTTLINGGVNDQSPDAASGEANLDVQLIVALTHPLHVEAYITAGSP